MLQNEKIIEVVCNANIKSFEDLETFLFTKDHNLEVNTGEDGFKPENPVLSNALSEHKKKEEVYHLLFVSPDWDGFSSTLVENLHLAYCKEEPLYVINSFELPEWFTDFKVTKTPTLVTSYGKFFAYEEYLPNIYNKLL